MSASSTKSNPRRRYPDAAARHRADRARLREKAFALFGGKCAECDVTDPLMLQIDHIDGATEPRGSYGRAGSSLHRQLVSGRRSTAGLQLLCANHNQRKRIVRGEHAGYKASRR